MPNSHQSDKTCQTGDASNTQGCCDTFSVETGRIIRCRGLSSAVINTRLGLAAYAARLAAWRCARSEEIVSRFR